MCRIKLRSNLLILFALVLIIGCKNGDVITPSSTPLIKSVIQGNSVQSYFYDNQNRVIKIVYTSTSSPTTSYEIYTYYQDTIYFFRSDFYPSKNITHTLPNGTSVIRQYNGTYVLNTKGLFEGNYYNKLFTSFIIDGDHVYDYAYDSNDFVITTGYGIIDYNYHDTLINDGKNYLNKTGITSGLMGEFSTSTTYEYYSDAKNTIGNHNTGKYFLGKSSENLLKSETTVYTSLDTTIHPDYTETTNYTYRFDSKGRVNFRSAEKTSSMGSSPTVVTTLYSYY